MVIITRCKHLKFIKKNYLISTEKNNIWKLGNTLLEMNCTRQKIVHLQCSHPTITTAYNFYNISKVHQLLKL